MNIVVWNENSADQQSRKIKRAYPNGMNDAIGEIFSGHNVTSAWLDQKDQGLSDELLSKTDVLLYWAHCRHGEVTDETVERIVKNVERGMGIIFLHSAHFSKPFKALMGKSGSLHWREDGKHERLYNVNPYHPIAKGIPAQIFIPKDEMYGEPFDIPTPDDIVFVGWYPGGEIFRSGFTYHYENGKIFYFQPGHETFPIYYQKEIKQIILNAALWTQGSEESSGYSINENCKHAAPLEKNIKLYVKKELK